MTSARLKFCIKSREKRFHNISFINWKDLANFIHLENCAFYSLVKSPQYWIIIDWRKLSLLFTAKNGGQRVGSRDLEGGGIRAACRIFGTGCGSITGRYQPCGGVLAAEPGPQALSSPQRCMFLRQRILSRDVFGESHEFNRECNRASESRRD